MLKAAHTPRSSPLNMFQQHKPVPFELAAPEEACLVRGGKGVSWVVFPLKVPVSPPALVHGYWQLSPSPHSFAEGAKRLGLKEPVGWRRAEERGAQGGRGAPSPCCQQPWSSLGAKSAGEEGRKTAGLSHSSEGIRI